MNITKVTNSNFVKIVLSLAVVALVAGLIVAIATRNVGALGRIDVTVSKNDTTGVVSATAATADTNIDNSTWGWYRYELVTDSRFGCNSNQGGLDAAGLKTATAAAEAVQRQEIADGDREADSFIAVHATQAEIYKTGSGATISNVFEGLSPAVITAYQGNTRAGKLYVCFYAQDTAGETNARKQEITLWPGGTGGTDDGNGAGKQDTGGGIPETGPTEDLLLGLFVIGVTASVICVRTLYVYRQRRNN